MNKILKKSRTISLEKNYKEDPEMIDDYFKSKPRPSQIQFKEIANTSNLQKSILPAIKNSFKNKRGSFLSLKPIRTENGKLI